MEWGTGIRLVVGFLLVLVNAFFVASEFALTRARQLPREAFTGSKGLERAWEMTERLEIYLTSCQLGITSSSILLGVVAEPAVTRLLEPLLGGLELSTGSRHVIAVVAAVVAINLVHKVWGEQAPTYVGVERPRAVARRLASGLYWWTRVMYPLIIAGDGLAKWTLRLFGVEIRRSWTREEGGAEEPIESYGQLQREMRELLARGKVSRDRRDEVLAALEIGERPISEIMVPREEIVALRVDRPFERNLEVLAERHHGRFPLVGDALEAYRGVIYVPGLFARLDDLRSGEVSLETLAAEPMRLDADTSIAEAIDRFQEQGQEMALVFEDGRVVGLLTSTDAFEAITGEMEDPLDLERDGRG
ncbi:MAG: hemolysin family protein [Gemmatimonadetes bacterium]|nr:hemolysin family protein [Gemmatimonadota bacterium]